MTDTVTENTAAADQNYLTIRANAEKIVGAIIEAGTLFLEAGAEVYRVEETMNRLGCAVPGVDDCISYVTVTGIMCSIVTQGHTVTRIARVGNGSRNLAVINAINQLSRISEKEHLNAQQLSEALRRIQNLPVYSGTATVMFGALGAAGFAFFFNGSWAEIIASFAIGILVRLITIFLDNTKLNFFFSNVVASFCLAYSAEWIHEWLTFISADTVIISVLMLLVPGLTITNALRDTMMGEYLSGVARLTEAMVIAASIALGVGLALYLFSMR